MVLRLVSAVMVTITALATSITTSSAGETRGIVELFTSQGCSSCPPADAVLQEYAKRQDIIALSFHVDYWDYLGWRDSFSNAEFTARQRHYASSRGDDQVYTPQAVINGQVHIVGSSSSGIEAALGEMELAQMTPFVEIRAAVRGEKLEVRVGPSPAPGRAADILLAVVQPSATVRIGRGENAGRTVIYRNVVRSLTKIGAWDGRAVSLAQPLRHTESTAELAYVVLLQQSSTGPILGATTATIE